MKNTESKMKLIIIRADLSVIEQEVTSYKEFVKRVVEMSKDNFYNTSHFMKIFFAHNDRGYAYTSEYTLSEVVGEAATI